MNMKRAAPLALVLLAACSGNPLGVTDPGGGGDPGTSSAVPAAIAVNLKAIAYNPTANGGLGSLSVTLDGVDASPVVATFVRNAALDVNGYRAYTYQESGLQRSHLALVAENARGNLQAEAVSDGGQFGHHFGGGNYARIDTYSQPSTGLFSYTGSYAGVFVPGAATTPGLPPALQPSLPYRVEGDVLINGSFADARVNGGVTNRKVIDDTGATLLLLESLNLVPTAIASDGRFLGDVELHGDVRDSAGNLTAPQTPQAAGKYGGLFGGLQATDVAGALVINPIRAQNDIFEYGTFNLPRCGTAGAGPLCALE